VRPRRLQRRRYVVAPPGNGFDTYRAWESLHLGRVPIVGTTCVPRKPPKGSTHIRGHTSVYRPIAGKSRVDVSVPATDLFARGSGFLEVFWSKGILVLFLKIPSP